MWHFSCNQYLRNIFSKLQSNSKILPRHVSHFVDKLGSVQYVVLWSDFHSNRYPDVEPLWRERFPYS